MIYKFYYSHYIEKKDSLKSYGFDKSFLLINKKKTFEDSYVYLNSFCIEDDTKLLDVYISSSDKNAINFLNTYYEEIVQTSAERYNTIVYLHTEIGEEINKMRCKLSNISTNDELKKSQLVELNLAEEVLEYLSMYLVNFEDSY